MPEIIHMVPIELAEGADPDELERVFAGSRALVGEIDGLLEAAVGADVSVEGMNEGYSHALVFRFADVASRDRFLTHPDHEAAGARLGPLLKRAMVLEVEVSE